MLPSEAERPQTSSAGSGGGACRCPQLTVPWRPPGPRSRDFSWAGRPSSGFCSRTPSLPPASSPSQMLREGDPHPPGPYKAPDVPYSVRFSSQHLQVVCSFLKATVINYHKLGGLEQQKGTLTQSGGQTSSLRRCQGCAPSKASSRESFPTFPALAAPASLS